MKYEAPSYRHPPFFRREHSQSKPAAKTHFVAHFPDAVYFEKAYFLRTAVQIDSPLSEPILLSVFRQLLSFLPSPLYDVKALA